MQNDFIKTVQQFTAVSAMGPSALRNQGTGILSVAQEYCSGIDLSLCHSMKVGEYLHFLDWHTEKLLDLFGHKLRPWGVARKALNLFFRDALYNKYLCQEFYLEKIETFLEIPLDSVVTKELRRRDENHILPLWTGLKFLTNHNSDLFQQFALSEAEKMNESRIHLDMYIWLKYRKNDYSSPK